MPESSHCFDGITNLLDDEDNAALFNIWITYLNEDRLEGMLIRFVYNINIVGHGMNMQNSL